MSRPSLGLGPLASMSPSWSLPQGPLPFPDWPSLAQATDLSCIVLFGACIESVVLRDKYAAFLCKMDGLCGQHCLSLRMT